MSSYDSDEGGIPLIEPLSDSDVSSAAKQPGKRKRADDAAAPESKRAKKRKNAKKPKDVSDETLDTVQSVNTAIGQMDSSLVADHIAQRTRRFEPDLSSVEAEDLHIPATAFRDSSSWENPRTLDTLASFLDKYAAPRRKRKKGPKLADAAEEMGMPHTIVVAASGIRAADLTRALRQFQTQQAFVAKLFAKHIKLHEAIETARQTRMNIGIGTPQRLIDLLDNGAVSAAKLERIVVDASHIDQKKRGIFDMRDTHLPLIKLLSRQDLKDRYGLDDEKRIELIIF